MSSRAQRRIEGRLSSAQAADIILIPIDEVQNFKREPSGRPRKNTPSWRISSGENSQFVTLIFVKLRSGQHDELTRKLEQIRRSKEHIFPGSVARTIIENKTSQIVIMLIWREAVMPDEVEREEALEAFRQVLADVLDWSTAQYIHGTALMHTGGLNMAQTPQLSYDDARMRAREAFQRCLTGDLARGQEQLQRARTALKRLDGDLPIARYSQGRAISSDAPFVTHSIEQARAWGWLEMASGVYQLVQQHPGAGLVHFKRVWRIWRPWSMDASNEAQREEARRERLRASLWLGESWARTISDRARQVADAVLHAALHELAHNDMDALLQETIQQQKQLPPAPPGSPAHRDPARSIPYVCSSILP